MLTNWNEFVIANKIVHLLIKLSLLLTAAYTIYSNSREVLVTMILNDFTAYIAHCIIYID